MRDQVENLGTGAEVGKWLTFVPLDFAQEAERMFPELCEVLDESVAETFYDDRCTVNDPAEYEDERVLQGILARVQLEERGIAPAPTPEQIADRQRQLDPGNDTPGIKQNKRKTYQGLKLALGLTIHPSRRR